MNSIKIVNRNDNAALILQQSCRNEIVRAVKGCIAEQHRRRRGEEPSNSLFRKILLTLSLVVLCFWGLDIESYGQQLRS